MIINSLLKAVFALRTYRKFGSNSLADLSFLEKGLLTRVNPINNKKHETIVRRVLDSYLKAKLRQQKAPFVYQPRGEWGEDIKRRRKEYIEALNKKDVNALSDLLKNFFRNSGVAGTWTYAYYENIANGSNYRNKMFINDILRDLAVWNDFVDNADISSLSVPPIGNPWGYSIKNNLLLPNSCRLNYYANNVKNLLSDIEQPVVAEIGGGYGGFAYYLLSSGKNFKYIDFDLPEVLLIEQYYLLNAFPEKKFLLFGETEDTEISENIISEYDLILLPNFQLPKLASNSVDLFINTASLSEMDYDTIEEYISHVVQKCKLYFYHENSDREVQKGSEHLEVPSSKFPIPLDLFKRIYKSDSLWGGAGGRYREHLYQRVKKY